MTRIAVVLGSATDRELVRKADMFGVFDAVGLDVSVHVLSAHRNAADVERYCREVDIDVYIGAAGLAAALPGALSAAAKFRRVVIGVPLDEYGIDSCIRLPPGVPVLTAGVGTIGLRNAAIAACQIAALSEPAVAEKLAAFLDATTRPPQFDVSIDAD